MNAASVSSLLHEGSVISTRIGQNSIWYRNVVYSTQDNMIQLGLTVDYLENLIMPGSKIILKHTCEYFEYIFEGIVSNIQTAMPANITVHINKAEEIINTRIFPRYDTYFASDMKPVWDDKTYFSIITNISLGGVAFASKHVYDYGEECDVCIYMPNSPKICCRGKVIRKSDKGEYIDYSMQFVDMDEENSNRVSEYLDMQGEIVEKMKADFFENVKKHLK
ncbi:MAG: PilZ domain-containing protein [Clostridia bacterium]|nr:PilZ domain-containing protein [Clostridia bacterium]